MSKATTAERALNRKGGTMSRLIKTLFGFYPVLLPLVVVGVVLCAIINSIGATFLQSALQIISESWQSGDWTTAQPKILQLVTTLACIYGVGILSSLFWNRAMAIVTQGSLEKLREKMFNRMQDLPIRYFDTNNHGDIMSYYTNDVDTLRQMISQSLPQLVNTVVTLVGVLASMLYLSVPLTVLALAMVGVMLLATKYLTGNSGKYFIKQQQELGKVNGYIEEMMNGQKVIKVFCHEDAVRDEFSVLSENLRSASTSAMTFAMILMPIMGNLSYVLYAASAAIGAGMTIAGLMDIGTIAAFLQYTRQFTNPLTQIAQQFNGILNALAGAERIFDLDGGQLLRDGAADQRGDRAVVDGRLGEIVPVRLRALERNEQVAGTDFAGIGLHSADAEMFKPGADLAAAPVCDLLEGQFFHSVLSKYDATTSRSSRCLFSWPIS